MQICECMSSCLWSRAYLISCIYSYIEFIPWGPACVKEPEICPQPSLNYGGGELKLNKRRKYTKRKVWYKKLTLFQNNSFFCSEYCGVICKNILKQFKRKFVSKVAVWKASSFYVAYSWRPKPHNEIILILHLTLIFLLFQEIRMWQIYQRSTSKHLSC
jgi:hypothetical protein